jgi:hypothetical protein
MLPRKIVQETAEKLDSMGELPTMENVELPDFMLDRPDDEKAIFDVLERKKAVLLTGMGGIGKTTLANSVFGRLQERHRTMPKCYVSLDWAQANSLTEVRRAQKDLLEKLAFVMGEPADVKGGRKLLAKHLKGKTVLLLVDNAQVSHLGHLLTCKDEDGKDTTIMDLLAEGSMVLMTSRARLAAHSKPLRCCPVLEEVQMKFLLKPQALELLMKISPATNLGTVAGVLEAVLERCGGLPLAVEVVGMALDENRLLWKAGQDGGRCLDEKALEAVYSGTKARTRQTLFETLKLTWEETSENRQAVSTLLDIVWFLRTHCCSQVSSWCEQFVLGQLVDLCLVDRCPAAQHGPLEQGAAVPNAVVDFCKLKLGSHVWQEVGQQAIKSRLEQQVTSLCRAYTR